MLRNLTQENIQRLLQSVTDNNCCRNNTQVKSFCILGTYLLNNNEHSHLIIKYGPLYDKIAYDLRQGLTPQTSIILNFVSALLYIDNDEGPTRRKSLHIYAQNTMRAKGCLSAICNLFMTHMMQQDTWTSLCQCIAKACFGSLGNQTFCSHLVPLCVKHCLHGNEDVILVLQSLIQRNNKNNRLFHTNNGMCIFTRRLLQNSCGLQLLNTILEDLPNDCIDAILQAQKVFNELYILSQMPGCSNQVARWTMIILYSREKVLGKYGYHQKDYSVHNNKSILSINNTNSDDTKELYENVMREVANFNRYDKFKSKQDDTGRKTQMFAPRSSSSRLSQRFTQKKPSNQSIDLSFTFLMRHNFNDSTRISKHNNTKNVSSRYLNSYVNNYDDSLNNNDLSDFKPVQCSTPKQRFVRDTTITRIDKKNSSYQNRTAKSNTKVKKRVPANKNFNRSFSAKLLDVFNSSCATVVQGFKKVFGKKTNERTIQYDDSCSYSFTNYVRKRQHVGSDEIRNAKEFSSCSTCNNTLELKDKMANDECLKQTIKKLKQGINLFGCDFKKISRTFWPNENYMTPHLLYNLYRKLIAK